MKKFSGKVEIHWSDYKPYAGECVRYVAPIGNQFFVMELQRCDIDYCGDDVSIKWNINQCIVDELTDEAIYTVSEEISTGRTPFATYPTAMRGLRKLLQFMEEEYEFDDDAEVVYHHLYALGTTDRRHDIYGKILKKMGWDERNWDGYDCYHTVIMRCGNGIKVEYRED